MSFARVYFLHSGLAGVSWASVLVLDGALLGGIVVLLGGMMACMLFWLLWCEHTRRIITKVRTAGKLLGKANSPSSSRPGESS